MYIALCIHNIRAAVSNFLDTLRRLKYVGQQHCHQKLYTCIIKLQYAIIDVRVMIIAIVEKKRNNTNVYSIIYSR